MKISELIAELQAIQAQHGPDLIVVKELPEPEGFAEVEEVGFGFISPHEDLEDRFIFSGSSPQNPNDAPSVYLS